MPPWLAEILGEVGEPLAGSDVLGFDALFRIVELIPADGLELVGLLGVSQILALDFGEFGLHIRGMWKIDDNTHEQDEESEPHGPPVFLLPHFTLDWIAFINDLFHPCFNLGQIFYRDWLVI